MAALGNIEPPSREEKRSKKSLLLWFERNWQRLKPLIPYVTLLDQNMHVIDWKAYAAYEATSKYLQIIEHK